MPRAIVQLDRAVTVPHAIPVLHRLAQHPHWDLAVSFAPWSERTRSGLPPIFVERLRRLGHPEIREGESDSADILLSFDPPDARWDKLPWRILLPSSLIGKTPWFGSRRDATRANLSDLILVPGPIHRERMDAARRVFSPTVAVGLPALDPLLGQWVAPRDALRAQLGLDHVDQVILYAPTWNPELSSWPLIWTRIRHLIDDHTGLILRPHPLVPDEFHAACHRIAEQHPAIHHALEPDIQPYLQVSDLVVTDHSSLAWEAACIGKPVVRVANSNREEWPGWDPTALELGLPEPGPVVVGWEGLPEAVARQLELPAEYAEARAVIRERMLLQADDQAGARIIDAMESLLRAGPARTAHESGIHVQIDLRQEDLADLPATLAAVVSDPLEPVELTIVDRDRLGTALLDSLGTWKARVEIVDEPPAFDAAGAPFVLLIRPGIHAPHGWLRRLANALRHKPTLTGIAPLAIHGRPGQEPAVLGIVPETEPSPTLDSADRVQRISAAGTVLTSPVPPSPRAVLVRRASTWGPNVLERWWTDRWPRRNSRFAIRVAADVVVEFPPLPEGDDERASAAVEERVADLSTWIQRVLPSQYQNEPDEHTGESASIESGSSNRALPGPLRLATHYLQQGMPEKARPLIQRALSDDPPHPATAELARKAGMDVRAEEGA